MTSRQKDFWLHVLGGVLLSGLTLWWTGSLMASFLWPTILGYARETEQWREQAERLSIVVAFRVSPGDPRYWSDHKMLEFVAWPIGAACVCVPAFVF